MRRYKTFNGIKYKWETFEHTKSKAKKSAEWYKKQLHKSGQPPNGGFGQPQRPM